jgi:cobalt-zinc-cadmium efflux system outer membrane protein
MLLLMLAFFPVSLLASETELNLQQALERFYAYNYDIIISKYDIDKSHADFITAKLRPNPNFTFNYTGLEVGRPILSSSDNSQVSARIDQLFELGGKRGLRTKAASETLDAARLTHDDVIRSLLIGFYTLFYGLNQDQLNLEAAKDELKRFDRTLLVAQKRHDAGFLSEIDFAKLKITRVDLETSLATLQNQYDTDLDQFSALLGLDRPLSAVTVQVVESYSSPAEETLVSKAYQNRYDLLSLKKQSEAAKTGYSLARAMRIPDVTVGAEYDAFAPNYNNSVGIGFSINIPIFDRNQGNIQKKAAESRQIDVQIDKTKRQIVSDIRQALYNYRSSYEIFTSYKNRKPDMDYLINNSEKAFAMGGITVLDLIDTEKTYFNYRKEYNKSLSKLNLNNELIKLYTGEMK